MKCIIKNLIFLVEALVSFGNAKYCTKFKCERSNGNYSQGHFSGHVLKDRFLDDKDQIEVPAFNESSCVRTCVKDQPCRTISIISDKNAPKKVRCFLSKSHIYEIKRIYRKGSKIIYLGTAACASSPCKNGLMCKPDFATGGYYCNGTSANFVDNRPAVRISFDKDGAPENIETNKGLKLKVLRGKIISV